MVIEEDEKNGWNKPAATNEWGIEVEENNNKKDTWGSNNQ